AQLLQREGEGTPAGADLDDRAPGPRRETDDRGDDGSIGEEVLAVFVPAVTVRGQRAAPRRRRGAGQARRAARRVHRKRRNLEKDIGPPLRRGGASSRRLRHSTT